MKTIHHLSLEEAEKLLGKFWEENSGVEDIYVIDAFLAWFYERGFEIIKEETLFRALFPKKKKKE